ncbi:hypothetical protein WG902_18395 [Ramlibacter sp. PS3R-8]|uniref:hypothetical protein n=1 Tax=Ramlibacter sp. PS3R-8 TaxID=3133437 RepID=UPI0030B2BDDB
MKASSNYEKQVIQSRILGCGRGFAVVDPERQPEIVPGYRTLSSMRDESPSGRSRRHVPPGCFSAPRDPGDEGGSVRRAR